MQQFLYCTVTAEKAVKHIVASNIRKWPHRETFSASSRCCMNLWIRGTGFITLKIFYMLNVTGHYYWVSVLYDRLLASYIKDNL